MFFIADPPHLLKTIRNCFARGKLWVCNLNFIHCVMYIFDLPLSVQVIKLYIFDLPLSVQVIKLIGT